MAATVLQHTDAKHIFQGIGTQSDTGDNASPVRMHMCSLTLRMSSDYAIGYER